MGYLSTNGRFVDTPGSCISRPCEISLVFMLRISQPDLERSRACFQFSHLRSRCNADAHRCPHPWGNASCITRRSAHRLRLLFGTPPQIRDAHARLRYPIGHIEIAVGYDFPTAETHCPSKTSTDIPVETVQRITSLSIRIPCQ